MNAALGLALSLMVGVPAQAWANSRLEEARGLYSAQKFAEALAVLRAAREEPTSTPTERLEILELLAGCQLAEGLREDAVSSFTELLSLTPNWEPPRATSPKIVDAWRAAQARIGPPMPPAPPAAPVEPVEPEFSPAPRVRDEAPVEAVATVVPDLRTAPTPPQQDGIFARKPAAWITAGLALCAGVAGGYLQLQSANSAQAARNDDWVHTARATHDRATSEATWALGLFVGAGAAGATSAALFAW